MLMGSSIGAAEETVEHLLARGERVGMIKVRLFRPVDADLLLAALPASVTRVAVLDRTKEPGADGEPLYKDVVTALAQGFSDGRRATMPIVVGGRYGLSSKEFTPAMVKGVFDELALERPRNHFTVGIIDDLTHSSLAWDPAFRPDAAAGVTACVFYGLGSDGTVSANKNSIKIIAEETPNYGQGYFEYDSKKAGAVTISHLRFGPKPISSTYLIGEDEAKFVACHQPTFVTRYDLLEKARTRRGLPAEFGDPGGPGLERPAAQDAAGDDREGDRPSTSSTPTGSRRRPAWAGASTPSCRTASSPSPASCPRTRRSSTSRRRSRRPTARRASALLDRNYQAIDAALAGLHQVQVPSHGDQHLRPPARGAGRCPGLRAAGHGHPDGRSRQRPARQPDAGRRHLAHRHHPLREAQPGAATPAAGTRTSAPSAASVRWSAPTRRSAPRSTRPGWRRRRPRASCHAADEGQGLPRGSSHHLPDGPGRLHRLRPVRRGLSHPRSPGPGPQGPEHGRCGRVPCRRAGQLGLLPDPARVRPRGARTQQDQARDADAAAVRVLRGLRGLRRDALTSSSRPSCSAIAC